MFLRRRLRPDQIYEIYDVITVTFKSIDVNGQTQVVLKTPSTTTTKTSTTFPEIYFACEEFDDFLSTFDCFSSHWMDSFSMIGSYNVIFYLLDGQDRKRLLKSEEAFTCTYLLHWNDNLIHQFSQHVYVLYTINCKWSRK